VCVSIGQGRLELINCDISSRSGSCSTVHHRADPRITGNKIHDGTTYGIRIEGAFGTFEDNEVTNMGSSGILLNGGADATFRRNIIQGGNIDGVQLWGGSRAVLEENSIVANSGDGVYVAEDSYLVMRGNSVSSNGTFGVWVTSGEGVIEGNEFTGQELPWEIDEENELKVRVRENKVDEPST